MKLPKPSSTYESLDFARRLILCRRQLPEAGFTLVEVIVAMLITAIFIVVSAQAITTAALIKARGLQISEANAWIQENLESVKVLALDTNQIEYTATTLNADAVSGQNIISVDSARGFRVGDAVLIGADSVNNTVVSINSETGQITLMSSLATTKTRGTSVIARCRADTATGGYGAYLNQNLPSTTSETANSNNPDRGTRRILGATHTLTRTATVRDVAPFEVSQLDFTVTNEDGRTIATVSTEVVPNAYFQCP